MGELNSSLSQKLKETVSQSEFKIDFLMKENDSLRKKLEDLIKLHEERMRATVSDDSSEEEMESETEVSTIQPGDGKEFSQDGGEPNKNGAADAIPVSGARMNVGAKAKKEAPKGTSVTQEKRISKSVPIITTYNANIKNIMLSIDNKLGHKNFSIKILGKTVANIGVCTLQDFETVKGLLKDLNIEFYTYTPKGRRPFTMVVEGLPDSFESSEIIEYLNGLQISLNIMNVWKLGGDKWVVKLARDSDIDGFYSIKYVLRCKVRIRKFRKRGITQCFNCQRFGHVAMNCNMQYRCVKCGESHGPGKCNIPPKGENSQETLSVDPVTGAVSKRVGLPVKCVNCGTEGHAASSKDCPRRIELVRKMEERKAMTIRGHSKMVNSPRNIVNSGVSYASVTRAALGDARPNGHGSGSAKARGQGESDLTLGAAMAQFDYVDRDCRRFFGGGLLQCLNKIRTFSREYRNLGNDNDKCSALLGMLMTLGQDG